MIAPSQIHVTSGEVMTRNVAAGLALQVARDDPVQRQPERLRLELAAELARGGGEDAVALSRSPASAG